MKISKLTAMLLGMTFLVTAPFTNIASAKEKKAKKDYTTFLDVTGQTQYLTSGGNVVVDNPVVQTTAGIDTGDFSLNLWSNYDTETQKTTEVDAELNIPLKSDSLEYVKGKLYAGWYHFPGCGDALHTSATIALDNLPLDVSVRASQVSGKDSGNGQKYLGNVSKTFNLSPMGINKTSATISGDATLNQGFFSDRRGWTHVGINGSLNYDLGYGVNISAGARWQTHLDEKFKGQIYEGWTGSVGISWTFGTIK